MHTAAPSPPAFRLESQGFAAAIDPGTGRVMHFGRRDGPNAFWTNPSGWDVGGWNNLGGEKIWLWPQDLWPEYFRRGWPPPIDGEPWKGNPFDGGVEWEISLEPVDRGTILRRAVLEASTFRVTSEIRNASPTMPFRLWSITQIPLPDTLRIPTPSGRCLPSSDPVFVRQSDEWIFQRAPEMGGKWFFEGNTISASTPAGMLTIRNLSSPDIDPSGPVDSLQIFFDRKAADLRPSTLPPYAELEFVAPVGSRILDLGFTLSAPPNPAGAASFSTASSSNPSTIQPTRGLRISSG